MFCFQGSLTKKDHYYLAAFRQGNETVTVKLKYVLNDPKEKLIAGKECSYLVNGILKTGTFLKIVKVRKGIFFSILL